MKKRYYLLIPVAFLALAGTGTALAYSGGLGMGYSGLNADPTVLADNWQNQINQEAQILGITVDEAKDYWANGKGMMEIAKEKGISQQDLQNKIKALRLEQVKTQLQTLVDKGLITQAQADTRLKFMENQNIGLGHMGKLGLGRGLKGLEVKK